MLGGKPLEQSLLHYWVSSLLKLPLSALCPRRYFHHVSWEYKLFPAVCDLRGLLHQFVAGSFSPALEVSSHTCTNWCSAKDSWACNFWISLCVQLSPLWYSAFQILVALDSLNFELCPLNSLRPPGSVWTPPCLADWKLTKHQAGAHVGLTSL